MWKEVKVGSDSVFFEQVFCKAIKTIKHPKDKLTIKVSNNQLYQFRVQYQDDNPDIMGIDVYKFVEDKNESQNANVKN